MLMFFYRIHTEDLFIINICWNTVLIMFNINTLAFFGSVRQHPVLVPWDLNETHLSLSVLARSEGHGPGFHTGTAALLPPELPASMQGGDVLGSDRVFQDSKSWRWYLEYLFTQGFDGLQKFIQSNVSWKLPSSERPSDVPPPHES